MEHKSWHGCYDDSWKGLIAPAAFAHPAKFSRGLIERIFDYMLARGWIAKGDTIGDPFGGIGTGGIAAAYRGLDWLGVELEGRFVKLAEQNFALHADKWETLRCPAPRIIQGDSRKFDELVKANAVVTSPPYADSINGGEGPGARYDFKTHSPGNAIKQTCDAEYGQSSGQIGSLKSGSLNDIVSSPPYAAINPEKNSGGVDLEKQYATYRKSGGGMSFEGFKALQEKHSQHYGQSPGQISALKLITKKSSSPVNHE
jgi:hypothetical protein